MVTSVALGLRPAKHLEIPISRRALHRSLVRLHLFAAFIHLPTLQDIAMDAIQDFYLRCDWDVSTSLVRHLYQDCSMEQSFRLRKWAIAMVAWTLSNGGSDPLAYNKLFAEFPDLWEDYVKHVHRLVDSNVDVRIKNPQLRLARNKLKSEEQTFKNPGSFESPSPPVHTELITVT
ncbi:hypothetical protein VPNG_09219 [Cytospora leucostoma]|uniref:Uncharacterized protein n=1 Tax=Cytospora leucostoma TaxID=1230097 RepID=A0A423VUC4_9PEZI|nr:hypothetical protein VPNG_09219 [Cytospora leucostoma]